MNVKRKCKQKFDAHEWGTDSETPKMLYKLKNGGM